MLQRQKIEQATKALRQKLEQSEAHLDIEDALLDCRGYLAGTTKLDRASGAYALADHSPRFDIFLKGLDEGSHVEAIAWITSMKWIAFDIFRKSTDANVFVFNEFSFERAVGIDVQLIQAAGWVDEALELSTYVWTDYYNRNREKAEILFGNPLPSAWTSSHSNPYLVNKPAWFTTMTTVDENLWRQHGYDPDMDSLGAYWMLAQVWDDPDPAKVRNALLAVREHNLGTTFIKDTPEGNRVYLVDEFLLLYDYDIRSVNMRRKLMGLPVVEVEDYIYDMDLPLDVLPFAKDDVFYPAYVKMCEELGVEPYAPDNSINVRIDPETLLVSKV